MIAGKVQSYHALVPVMFRPAQRPDVTIEFVVDTGFVGFLTLPPAAVAALGLPFLHDTPANLADDSEVQLPVHEATIVWQDVEQRVRLLATGKRPLLGMALLDGQELVVQCTNGGLVTVDTL